MARQQQRQTPDVAVEVVPGRDLAIVQGQDFWNAGQIAVIRQLGAERANNGDLAVFFHVSQRTGLDPFARQIHLVPRDGKMVIQTGIDGYRLVARRATDAAGGSLAIGASQWCGADGQWRDVWLEDGYPSAARVVVTRDGQEFPGVALWREYVQTTVDSQTRELRVTRMWDQRPAGQLAKCAEALALRRAFPQDLSGLFVDAELDRSNVVQGQVVRSGLAAELEAEQVDETTETTTEEVVEVDPEDDYVAAVKAQDAASEGQS